MHIQEICSNVRRTIHDHPVLGLGLHKVLTAIPTLTGKVVVRGNTVDVQWRLDGTPLTTPIPSVSHNELVIATGLPSPAALEEVNIGSEFRYRIVDGQIKLMVDGHPHDINPAHGRDSSWLKPALLVLPLLPHSYVHGRDTYANIRWDLSDAEKPAILYDWKRDTYSIPFRFRLDKQAAGKLPFLRGYVLQPVDMKVHGRYLIGYLEDGTRVDPFHGDYIKPSNVYQIPFVGYIDNMPHKVEVYKAKRSPCLHGRIVDAAGDVLANTVWSVNGKTLSVTHTGRGPVFDTDGMRPDHSNFDLNFSKFKLADYVGAEYADGMTIQSIEQVWERDGPYLFGILRNSGGSSYVRWNTEGKTKRSEYDLANAINVGTGAIVLDYGKRFLGPKGIVAVTGRSLAEDGSTVAWVVTGLDYGSISSLYYPDGRSLDGTHSLKHLRQPYVPTPPLLEVKCGGVYRANDGGVVTIMPVKTNTSHPFIGICDYTEARNKDLTDQVLQVVREYNKAGHCGQSRSGTKLNLIEEVK